MSNTPTKIVEVVHAELLSDIQKLRAEVKQVSDEIPTLYQGVKKDIEESSESVKQIFQDFHSLAEAIAIHIKKTRKEGLAEMEEINKANANYVAKSLEPYTKYFWLLIGISAGNSVLLLLTVFAIVFFR